MFLISTFVPNSLLPSGATEIFASNLKLPFSNLPSEIFKSIASCLNSSIYATACFDEVITGLVTISTKGTPDRLKSSAVLVADSILPEPLCVDFPVSSSICTLSIWILSVLSSITISSSPFRPTGKSN